MAKQPTFEQRMGAVAYYLDNVRRTANGSHDLVQQGRPEDWRQVLSDEEVAGLEAAVATAVSAIEEASQVVARGRARSNLNLVRRELAEAEAKVARLEGRTS